MKWFTLLLVVPFFFIWSAIHEGAHWLMARSFVKLRDSNVILWPHFDRDGVFYFASISWNYVDKHLTRNQLAWTLFAPRWFDLLAVCLLPFAYLFSGAGLLVWLLFWGSGLVDLLVGSIDRNDEAHDMVRYSEIWNISPWIFRIGGVFLILTSLITTLILLFT